eukprot:scaffold94671_cov53-Cyclotella_meneghiniana.AAC.4
MKMLLAGVFLLAFGSVAVDLVSDGEFCQRFSRFLKSRSCATHHRGTGTYYLPYPILLPFIHSYNN